MRTTTIKKRIGHIVRSYKLIVAIRKELNKKCRSVSNNKIDVSVNKKVSPVRKYPLHYKNNVVPNSILLFKQQENALTMPIHKGINQVSHPLSLLSCVINKDVISKQQIGFFKTKKRVLLC